MGDHYNISDIQDVYDNAIRGGAAKERERIIALLEAEQNECDCEQPVLHLIALVKGKTK